MITLLIHTWQQRQVATNLHRPLRLNSTVELRLVSDSASGGLNRIIILNSSDSRRLSPIKLRSVQMKWGQMNQGRTSRDVVSDKNILWSLLADWSKLPVAALEGDMRGIHQSYGNFLPIGLKHRGSADISSCGKHHSKATTANPVYFCGNIVLRHVWQFVATRSVLFHSKCTESVWQPGSARTPSRVSL